MTMAQALSINGSLFLREFKYDDVFDALLKFGSNY